MITYQMVVRDENMFAPPSIAPPSQATIGLTIQNVAEYMLFS